MKVCIGFEVFGQEGVYASLSMEEAQAGCDYKIEDIESCGGRLVFVANETKLSGEYEDPLIRLMALWLRKMSWVLGGDVETIALRDSDCCYSLEPTSVGKDIEIGFFRGSEVEEVEADAYIMEPLALRLKDYAEQSLKMGENLVDLVKSIDAELLESSEDCRELVSDLEEARAAWQSHQSERNR